MNTSHRLIFRKFIIDFFEQTGKNPTDANAFNVGMECLEKLIDTYATKCTEQFMGEKIQAENRESQLHLFGKPGEA